MSRKLNAKRLKLHELQSGICPLCGGKMKRPDRVKAIWTATQDWAPTIDHILPRSMGGTDALENLALVHRGCNMRRAVKPFPQERFALLAFRPTVHAGEQ